ncbi:hypothetical protein PIB30_108587 [Stylosanthes scabra]|uniref:Uncharacterized protein n=1 Tax=Stylosanthes scabra TaxID=79078 RepID=A0ABU6XYH4_9FABA|nr:hypothetical protein [Stylosanthes scabra]
MLVPTAFQPSPRVASCRQRLAQHSRCAASSPSIPASISSHSLSLPPTVISVCLRVSFSRPALPAPGLETASQPFLPFCNNPVGHSWKSRRSLVGPPSSARRESRRHPSALLLGRSLRYVF